MTRKCHVRFGGGRLEKEPQGHLVSRLPYLWAVVGFRFPFGFEERLVSEDTLGVTQRPFEPDMRPADLVTVQIDGLAQVVPADEPVLEFAAGSVPLPDTVCLPLDRKQRFPFGELVITHDAALALHNAGQTAEPYLRRHLARRLGHHG